MFNTAAAASRRDRWVETPDEETVPACEDHAWLLDLRARDHRIRFAPDSVVIHAHAESFQRCLRRRLLEYRGLTPADAVRGHPVPVSLVALVDRLERWHARPASRATG